MYHQDKSACLCRYDIFIALLEISELLRGMDVLIRFVPGYSICELPYARRVRV